MAQDPGFTPSELNKDFDRKGWFPGGRNSLTPSILVQTQAVTKSPLVIVRYARSLYWFPDSLCPGHEEKKIAQTRCLPEKVDENLYRLGEKSQSKRRRKLI